MKNLIYKSINSDIKLSKLKLEKIEIHKQHLKNSKPLFFRKKERTRWQQEFNQLLKKEEIALDELNTYYDKLGKLI